MGKVKKLWFFILLLVGIVTNFTVFADKKAVEERLKNDFEQSKKTVIKVTIKLANNELLPVNFTVYDPPIHLNYVYDTLDEVGWSTPEQLMLALNSEDSQPWHNSIDESADDLGNSYWEYRKNVKQNPELNHIIIPSRFDFKYQDVSYCLFKYWDSAIEKNDPDPVAFYRELILKGDKWLIRPGSWEFNNWDTLHSQIRTAVLVAMLTGKFTSNYSEITKLYRDTYQNGVFNGAKFAQGYFDLIWTKNREDLKDILSRGSENENQVVINESYQEWKMKLEQKLAKKNSN
ncbi:MAG TPA: hypothetical protein VHY08_21940 [Bacillota bacterium]|nr:hypothetical protein [Bacillota bacterium]